MLDMARVEAFASMNMDKGMHKRFMDNIRLLQSRNVSIFINDLNQVIELEDVMDNPGYEAYNIVKNAVNSLPPVEK